jgi:hypothetical protein
MAEAPNPPTKRPHPTPPTADPSTMRTWESVFAALPFVECGAVGIALAAATDGPGVVFVLPYFAIRFIAGGFWPWYQLAEKCAEAASKAEG